MMKYALAIIFLAFGLAISIGVAPKVAAACTPIAVGVPDENGNTTNCVGDDTPQNNPIYVYLRGIIRVVAGLVGLAVVINIMVGGLQYMTSQGDPGAITKAKTRIFNAVVSLIAFLFAATIINYIIPGGVLS